LRWVLLCTHFYSDARIAFRHISQSGDRWLASSVSYQWWWSVLFVLDLEKVSFPFLLFFSFRDFFASRQNFLLELSFPLGLASCVGWLDGCVVALLTVLALAASGFLHLCTPVSNHGEPGFGGRGKFWLFVPAPVPVLVWGLSVVLLRCWHFCCGCARLSALVHSRSQSW